jgi:hypothetical protein
VTLQGFELRPSAQVTNTVSTIPLRMTKIAADNKKSFNWVCLLAFRWGLGSNLLGSPFNIAIKK